MATYQELIAEIQALQKQAEKTRKMEFESSLKAVKKMIADFGFTATDLGLGTKSGSRAKSQSKSQRRSKSLPGSKKRQKVAPKFRDDVTNETWTGRGKMPVWLRRRLDEGNTIEKYMIQS